MSERMLSVAGAAQHSTAGAPTFATASISSMNTMAGASLRALANSSRTRMAPMPTYSSTNSEAEMEKKGTSASPATARASRVFPVPGGPTRSTPGGKRRGKGGGEAGVLRLWVMPPGFRV